MAKTLAELMLTYDEPRVPELAPEPTYWQPDSDAYDLISRADALIGADSGKKTDSSEPKVEETTEYVNPGWYIGEISTSTTGSVTGTGTGSVTGTGTGTGSGQSSGGTYDMKGDLEGIFSRNGIHATVTSGKRKPGEAGKLGDKSKHVGGTACDVVPMKGYTYDDIYAEMSGSKEFTDYLASHNYGVIDERPESVRRKTGASGPHWHIGDDSGADRNFFKAIARKGGRIERGLGLIRQFKKGEQDAYSTC